MGLPTVFPGEIPVNDGKTELRFTANSYQVLSFTSSLASIRYRTIQTKSGIFTELYIPGYGNRNSVGDPKLPVLRKLIEIPLNATCTVNLSNEKYKEYDLATIGIKNPVIPAQAPLSKHNTDPSLIPFVINSFTYQQNQWLGGPLVTVTHVGFLRSLDLARLEVSPVWYNPVTGKLRVYESFDVTVSFVNGDVPATIELKRNTWSPFFTNLLSQVVNYKMAPDSLITNAPVTYVIIAPPAFHDALQPFIAWKEKKGFRVITGYTDNPAVGNTTTSIKAYLQGLYNNPPAGYQKPSFVLFAGDISLIPAWTDSGHPSDLYYCEYTSDFIPEVFYGRFAAGTLAQLQAYIDKTLEYEQYTMPSDAFLGEATMVAGADPNMAQTYGNGQINYGTNTYFNTAHNILSHTYLQPEPTGGNYAQNIHQNVSDGVTYANYTAHGSEAGWADPEFQISDIPALLNNHKYCLMVGNCCKTSNYSTTCFAEEITRTAGKGALGYIGCSDYSYWDEDFWWADGFKMVSSNPVYDPQHLGAYDVTFHDSGEPASKWFVTMGQMVVGGCLAVEESSSGMKQYYWEAYCLMGDPSLSVYYSVPGPVAAAYQNTLVMGETSLLVTTEPYAYVALSLHDTILLDARCADSSGIVNLSFTPLSSPDSLSVVITKQNRKPHIGKIAVTPASGAYVILNMYTVSDSTGGNNNHLPDYNESVTLNVTVKNIGVLTASNVTGTISTTDTNITITSNSFNFGTITAGGSVTGQDAFAVTIKNNVADQHQVFCPMVLTDGTNNWNSVLLLTLNAPVLHTGNVTVLDPTPGGNGNGILDPGESASLKISMGNSGHATSTNTIGHLTVEAGSASYILVTTPNSYYGSLNPGTTDYLYFPVVTNGITPAGTPVNLDYLVTGGANNQYGAQETLSLTIGQPPQYILCDSMVSTCNGLFYDSGGPLGNYLDNESYTETFNPGTAGAKIQAVFTSFDVETETNCGYDWLNIYDGPTTASPLLGTFCGTTLPGPFVGTAGPLTFQFSSDYSDNFTGWTASISCVGGPLNLAANAFPTDVCLGSSSQLTAIPSGGSGMYTYQWTPATYLDDPESRTPVSTPATDITYTVTVNDGVSSLTSGPVTLTVHALPPTPVITLAGHQLTSSSPTGNQWYLNDALIPGATAPVYTPAASGNYFVVVSDAITGCPSDPSNIITFLITGTDVYGPAGKISVYPNPFRDDLTMSYELQEPGSVKISLFDAFGKEVRMLVDDAHQPAGPYSIEIAGGNLEQGVYVLRIRSNQFTVTKKIIHTK